MKRPSKIPGAAEERRQKFERELDEALEDSFPASDPPASTRTSAGAPDHSASRARGQPHDVGPKAAPKSS